jgi:hypothetical protein
MSTSDDAVAAAPAALWLHMLLLLPLLVGGCAGELAGVL